MLVCLSGFELYSRWVPLTLLPTTFLGIAVSIVFMLQANIKFRLKLLNQRHYYASEWLVS